MAAVTIDGPVGMRFKKLNVKNNSKDQGKVLGLLSSIPEAQGGKKKAWATTPLSGPDGTCPQLLVDAIWDFQMHWKNKKLFKNIDAVVDPNMNTLKQLNNLAAGGSVEPPNPPVDPATKPLDIILRFTGGPGGNRRDNDRENALRRTFNTAGYLKTHQPIEAICFTGFREQEQFVGAAVANVVLRRGETNPGLTIVIGSSAGGVSALKAAVALTEKNVRLTYVGINDAAFLKDEVTTKPKFVINLNTVTGGKRIDADLKENFFQTFGHNWQFDSNSPNGHLSWAEFHGPLDGFVNQDLRDKPRVVAVVHAHTTATLAAAPNDLPIQARDRFAKLVHRHAGGEAEGPIAARVNGLIKA